MSSINIPDGLPDIVAARFQEAKESGELLAFDSTATVLDVNGIPVTIPRAFLHTLFRSFLYIISCSFLYRPSFLPPFPSCLQIFSPSFLPPIPSYILPRSFP
jgi:hypothetical protein